MKQSTLDFSKAKPKTNPTPFCPSPVTSVQLHDTLANDNGHENGVESDAEEDESQLSKSGNKMLEKFHDMSVKERRRLVCI